LTAWRTLRPLHELATVVLAESRCQPVRKNTPAAALSRPAHA